MIGFVRWLLGGTHDDPGPDPAVIEENAELDAQLAEAAEQLDEARKSRRRAEEVGPYIREGLKHDRFGAAMAAALEPRGWSPQ